MSGAVNEATRASAIDLSGQIEAPVVDQRALPLCAAAVTAALASHLANRVSALPMSPSVLFSHWTARVVARRTGRWGNRLTDCFAAWQRFGLVSEEDWPLLPDRIDVEPDARCLAIAAGSARPVLERLDAQVTGTVLLDAIQERLSANRCVTVEYPLHPSQFLSADATTIPVLPPMARAVGAHVVLAVGYDNARFAGGGGASSGALLVRNSWGLERGRNGYGWLPYEFVTGGFTRDHSAAPEEALA